jgi:hypothetical protein
MPRRGMLPLQARGRRKTKMLPFQAGGRGGKLGEDIVQPFSKDYGVLYILFNFI